MRKQLLSILILTIVSGSISLTGEGFPDYAITNENAKVLSQFIQAARKNDRRTMAGLIHYPLRRHYPIPPINNAGEMLQRFDHVFDRELINEIASSSISKNWSAVGWRGIMLNQGVIWAHYDGYLYVINNQSEFESKLQAHLIEEEKHQLHPSLKDLLQPVLIACDNRRIIRIDGTKSGYRYTAWPADKKQNQKPELIIEGGSLDVQGTMRFHTYEFKSGSYLYVFEKETAQLLVFNGEKEVLSSKMHIVQPFRFIPGDFKNRFGNYRPIDF